MVAVESLMPLSKRLFIDVVDTFELVFCQKTKHYQLKNHFNPKCHFLELCIIPDGEYTGNKLNDIAKKLNVSVRWVFGFYHGFKNNTLRFKDGNYISGYQIGAQLKAKSYS